MAAFCTCCGAAITSKSERCAVCGAPSHGMVGATPISMTVKEEVVTVSGCTAGLTGCKHLPAVKSHLNAWK